MGLLGQRRTIVEEYAIEIVPVIEMTDAHSEKILRYLGGGMARPIDTSISLQEESAIDQDRSWNHIHLT